MKVVKMKKSDMIYRIVFLVIIYTGGVTGACSENITLDGNVTLIDLGKQDKLPVKCVWNLKAPKDTTIVVKIDDIQLRGSLDRFISLDGPNETSSAIQQCGVECSLNDVVMVTSENSMMIRIDLDVNQDIRLVSVKAWAQDNGGRFYDNGTFSLNNSTSNTSYYQFHSTTAKQVQVMLDDSLMYPTSSVRIYDGISEQAPLLANFRSEGTTFVPITSSQHDLLLVTEGLTDQSYLGGNFQSIEEGCHKVSSGSFGEFQLERKKFKTECDWLINPTQSAGLIILDVTSVNLCDNETLVFYEGLSTYGNRLASVTMATKTSNFPRISASTKKGLSIYINKPGTSKKCTSTVTFSGSYQTVPDCNGHLGMTGTLTSPLYPNQYPLNSICEWSTNPVNKNTSLYVTINKLDLTNQHNITVKNTNRTKVTYTGSNLPDDLVTMVTNNTKASVVFDSQTGNLGNGLELPGQGFNVSYRILDCGDSLTAGKGTINSMKDIPTNSSECIWIVTVPPKTGNKTVNIVSLKINITGVANWQNLELRDGGSVRSPLLNKGVSMVKTQSFLTRYNTLWIHYRKNTTAVIAKKKFSFTLEYSTYSCDSKQQCKNGLCLHPDWKCNGKDDCGDNTDEIGCGSSSPAKGVKIWLTIVIGVICFLIGVVMTIVIPALYKRYKYPNYSQLKDMMDPSIS